MIPSRLFLVLLVAWMLLGLLTAFWPWLLWLWAGAGVLLALTAIWQWIGWRKWPAPHVERFMSEGLALGQETQVTLRIENLANKAMDSEVFDHFPSSMLSQGHPKRVAFPAGEIVSLSYRVTPQERGDLVFETTQILMSRPNSLWSKSVRVGEPQTIHVYPNFSLVARYAIRAQTDRLIGLRKTRRRGEGLEFHQLRDYRLGDQFRQIDWKATSRRGQLISREYQEERNQQIVFALDCGRRMRSKDDELSHFDHALNSLLLLSHVALRQGDSVGVIGFSGEASRSLAPVKGVSALNQILRHTYDLKTSTRPSDFVEAATQIQKLVPRRALVVWLTNIRDEDDRALRTVVNLLRKRHLILVASLRETILDDLVERPVDGLEDATRLLATHEYLERRERLIQSLKSSGVRTLDVTPSELPPYLVDEYLDIKASGVL